MINLDQTVQDLTVAEREQLFTLLTQNIELFRKVIPGSPLLAYIAGDAGIGTMGSNPIVQHLTQWQQDQ